MPRILLLLLMFPLFSSAQNEKAKEAHLLTLFNKIQSYNFNDVRGDSLQYFNEVFEDALLNTLQKDNKTINYNFQKLTDAGLHILTSPDNKLRFYYWDDMQGGTMRYINNVVQSQTAARQSLAANDDDGFITGVNILKNGATIYYLVTTTFRGSSALFIRTIQIYNIDSKAELVKAPIIKTTQRITNKLSCEIDYSAQANKDVDINIPSEITYDSERKQITIPLILENNKITSGKIVYRFNGKYFVKL